MEHNRPAQPHQDQAADQSSQGAFKVGDEIRERGTSAERPDVAQAADRGTDSSAADVVGDNDGVVGDADAMTAGDSAHPAPDDDAMRPWGRATPERYEEGSDLT